MLRKPSFEKETAAITHSNKEAETKNFLMRQIWGKRAGEKMTKCENEGGLYNGFPDSFAYFSLNEAFHVKSPRGMPLLKMYI